MFRNPVLSLEVDSVEPVHFSRLTVLLKPKDQLENYTCVYYDAAGKISCKTEKL